MADLSTLDATQPPDTQVVGQGAQRIRETRDATITSFDVEHYLTGEHQFSVGTTAARPAAGFAGRIYINTGTNSLERDTGAAWQKAHLNRGGSVFGAASFAINTSYQILSSVIVELSQDSAIRAMGSFRATSYSMGIRAKIQLDGVDMTKGEHIWQLTNAADTMEVIVHDIQSAISAGLHQISLVARTSSSTTNVVNRFLEVFDI